MTPSPSPQHSKLEPEKIQFRKIMPRDRKQSKKSGEHEKAKTSLPSLQRKVKRRSAFKDLSNASESWLVRSKKEDTEVVRNVSKRMNYKTYSLGFPKDDELKSCEEPESTASSTTSLSETEKQLTVDISAKSKIPANEERAPFKKALVFNEEPAIEESTLIKKPLKRHIPHGEMLVQEQPLTLLEEDEYCDLFGLSPMTFGRKCPPEEPVFVEGTISSKKRILYQDTQNKEKLVLVKSKTYDNHFSVELVDKDEPDPEPLIEEASVVSRPLSLKNKCSIQGEEHTIQGNRPFRKSLGLQKVTTTTYSEEPVTTKDYYECFPELFSPYSSENEDNFKSQKSLDLQEKIDTQNDPPQKPLDSQNSLSSEEAFIRKFVSKDKRSSEEESSQESIAQEQEFLLKRDLYENSSGNDDDIPLTNCPVAFRGQSIMEKEDFKECLKTQEKISTEKMTLVKKPLMLQGDNIEKILFKEHTTDIEADFEKEATLKDPLDSLEKSRSKLVPVLRELLQLLQKPCMEKLIDPKEPLTLQENPKSKTEDLLKELLTLLEKPHTEQPLAFQQKTITEREVSLSALKENLSIEKEANPPLKETLNCEEKSFSKTLFSPQVLSKSNLSSCILESRSSNYKDDNMCHISKLNPGMKVAQYKPGSKSSPSSLCGMPEEICIVEDRDKQEDSELEDDLFISSVNGKDILSFLKEREEKFRIEIYMYRQIIITRGLRTFLVEWLVDIQETFQLSHDSLYLAMKLVDHYLIKVTSEKIHLTIIGSAAYMIAAKFQETYPPSVSDFMCFCQEFCESRDLLNMEMNILKALDFDIDIPTASHFLHRFALNIRTSMRTLTLSYFICEMTLMDCDYIQEKPSKLAAASFLLALYMRDKKNGIPFLEQCSGYQITELRPLVRRLNRMLILQSSYKTTNVYRKYSKIAFFRVTRIPPLKEEKLEKMWKM